MLRDKVHLTDILESAKIAASHIGNKSQEDFLEDQLCQDAVIRRLEIIGEAARRISPENKSTFTRFAVG
jgi:uncharacterized protein with HEPN domain